MTLYEKALAAVAAAGLDAAKPGEKIGPCKSPYVVVYNGGVIQASRVTGYRVIGAVAFVPLGRRTELDEMLQSAAAALAGIGMRPRGSPSAEGIDEAFKAHTLSTEYIAPCAL